MNRIPFGRPDSDDHGSSVTVAKAKLVQILGMSLGYRIVVALLFAMLMGIVTSAPVPVPGKSASDVVDRSSSHRREGLGMEAASFPRAGR